MKFKYNILIFWMLVTGYAFGQLVTNNSNSATTLVNDILAGEGVEISNVTYTGDARAIGEFFGASSNIGLNHGIIMSTGTVLNEVNGSGLQKGPVGPNNNPNAKTDFKAAGDADIAALVSKETFDAAVLEFDFIPEGDTVKFRYVFASEEYPSQISSGANDFFAFFISGAGIAGKKNIALLPGTSTAVSIETVNAGTNASFYISNGNGLSGAEFTDPSVINYNAFTTVLTAISAVQPCQTYHLKIVITDVLDGIFDSGVFLEASSLNSAPIFEIAQDANFSPNGSKTEIFENCGHHGELKITRENKLYEPLYIDYSVQGSAINGVDYELLSGNVTFAIGENAKTISVKPITDALSEGEETVTLKFSNPDQCNASLDSLTFTYQIKDRPTFNVDLDTVSTTCPGESIEISANVSGGVVDYTYKWLPSGTETGKTTKVQPLAMTTFDYEAQDVCGQTVNGSVTVNVPVYPPMVVQPMTDTVIQCRGAEVTFVAGATGGAGDYSFIWNSGQTSKRATNTILNDVTYSVDIFDKCQDKVTDDVFVKLDYPTFSVLIREDTVHCYGDTISLSASAIGGVPPYNYSWEDGLSNPYLYPVQESKFLQFTAYDSCGIIPAIDSVLIEVRQPTASFAVNANIPEPNEPVKFLNDSKNAIRFYWDFSNGYVSEERQPTISFDSVATYPVTLYAFDELDCADTLTRDLPLRHPLYYYLPSSFSPNGDGLNDIFIGKSIGVTEFSMSIFDRGGQVIYSTTDVNEGWDGNLSSGQPAPGGVYVVKIIAKSNLRLDHEYKFAEILTVLR